MAATGTLDMFPPNRLGQVSSIHYWSGFDQAAASRQLYGNKSSIRFAESDGRRSNTVHSVGIRIVSIDLDCARTSVVAAAHRAASECR